MESVGGDRGEDVLQEAAVGQGNPAADDDPRAVAQPKLVDILDRKLADDLRCGWGSKSRASIRRLSL